MFFIDFQSKYSTIERTEVEGKRLNKFRFDYGLYTAGPVQSSALGGLHMKTEHERAYNIHHTNYSLKMKCYKKALKYLYKSISKFILQIQKS